MNLNAIAARVRQHIADLKGTPAPRDTIGFLTALDGEIAAMMVADDVTAAQVNELAALRVVVHDVLVETHLFEQAMARTAGPSDTIH